MRYVEWYEQQILLKGGKLAYKVALAAVHDNRVAIQDRSDDEPV